MHRDFSSEDLFVFRLASGVYVDEVEPSLRLIIKPYKKQTIVYSVDYSNITNIFIKTFSVSDA